MRQPCWKRTATLVVVAPLAILLWAAALDATAQEKKAENAKPAAKAGRAAGNKAAKPQGRLPAHYAQVITDEQRQRIYAIQAKHAEKIKALRSELAELQKAIDAEIEAVLTDEQKQQFAALVSAAKEKRKAGPAAGNAKKATEAKPAAK